MWTQDVQALLGKLVFRKLRSRSPHERIAKHRLQVIYYICISTIFLLCSHHVNCIFDIFYVYFHLRSRGKQ